MPFGTLWMPVLASAAAVFVVSSIIHMALRYHRADYKPFPNEDAAREGLGRGTLPPGQYVLPYCKEMKDMADPAMQEKYKKGPVAIVNFLPNGVPGMGKLLGLWFAFSVLVSFVAGYVARQSLTADTDGMTVMQVTGTVAFAGYFLGNISDSIWKAQPWSNTARFLIDGLAYAVVTGLVFRLLWPSA